MIKKEYQKPTMQMIQLQHHDSILDGSPPKELSGTEGHFQELDARYNGGWDVEEEDEF